MEVSEADIVVVTVQPRRMSTDDDVLALNGSRIVDCDSLIYL